MSNTLTFIENDNKRGALFHLTDDDNLAGTDISGCTEIEWKVFLQDFSTNLFTATLTGSTLAFHTDGTDGKVKYVPPLSSQMTPAGTYKGEVIFTFADTRKLKIQDQIIIIKKEGL